MKEEKVPICEKQRKELRRETIFKGKKFERSGGRWKTKRRGKTCITHLSLDKEVALSPGKRNEGADGFMKTQ